MRSSPVSRRRMVPTAIGIPFPSFPVMASSASPISGTLRTKSISACMTDPRPSTWSTALTSNEGAMTGSIGVSSGPTLGSPTMSLIRASICESPSGVSASPRKRSVATLAAPESPKCSSISARTLATALPSGRVAAVSGGCARRVVPAPSTTVMIRRTRIVNHGRTVTCCRSQPSALLIVYLPIWDSRGR